MQQKGQIGHNVHGDHNVLKNAGRRALSDPLFPCSTETGCSLLRAVLQPAAKRSGAQGGRAMAPKAARLALPAMLAALAPGNPAMQRVGVPLLIPYFGSSCAELTREC